MKQLLLLAPLVLLLGCSPSSAQNETAPAAPSTDELRLATSPGYTPPNKARQECLGRLVFDVPRDMQWGVQAPGSSQGERFGFTDTMQGGQDYVGLGNIAIVVSAPANKEQIGTMLRIASGQRNIAIADYKSELATTGRLIERLKKKQSEPEQPIDQEEADRIKRNLSEYEAESVGIKTSLANLKTAWYPIDLGMPQALGYNAGGTLYAFLLRDGRAYQFMDTGGENDPPVKQRIPGFVKWVKRFQVRALYSIPKEPGICIPYGFVPDDGTGHFRTEVSLRYADRPGVIYTINTAIAGEHGIDGPEMPLLQATARAGTGVFGGALTQGRDTQSVGPKPVNIGALPGSMGGVSMNVADPGKPPVRSYSVYAGYGGWMHSQVLPIITVNMRSFTKEQEPTLKSDPPNFEESLGRLDELLKSIRLRPTVPAMPELNAGK